MRAYRKMMKTSWKEKKTNEEQLNISLHNPNSKEKKPLRNLFTWSHVDSIDRLLLEIPVERRGRPRTEWMINMKDWTGMTYKDLVRFTQDREQRSEHDSPPSWRRQYLMNEWTIWPTYEAAGWECSGWCHSKMASQSRWLQGAAARQ